MKDRVTKAEIGHMELYCKSETMGSYVRFADDEIRDMYSHNFTYVLDGVSDEAFHEIISKELEYRKKDGKRYLRIVTETMVDDEFLASLPIKPEVEYMEYYGIQSSVYPMIKTRDGVAVKAAKDPLTMEHGRFVDVAANYEDMEMEFAIRRIDRKSKVYSNNKEPMDLYVCYDGHEPVGNCELMFDRDNGIAKIEDFDILKIHQRKGYGSTVIHHLLKVCHEQGIEDVYLLTGKDETAREMYMKLGFKKLGERMELMFGIN